MENDRQHNAKVTGSAPAAPVFARYGIQSNLRLSPRPPWVAVRMAVFLVFYLEISWGMGLATVHQCCTLCESVRGTTVFTRMAMVIAGRRAGISRLYCAVHRVTQALALTTEGSPAGRAWRLSHGTVMGITQCCAKTPIPRLVSRPLPHHW